MSDFPITLYHRPQCSTSRQVLGMIRQAGYEPEIIDYSKVGWTKPLLKRLFKAMKASPRDLLRVNGTPAEALGLTAEGVSDDDILNAMVKHPILVNRPIVVTPKGTALIRPYEKLPPLLDKPIGDYLKEDGQIITL